MTSRIAQSFWQSKLALSATLGFAYSTALYWPGFHSFDSLDRLRQARVDQINDHYPPLVAVLSQWVDGAIPVSIFFLILQLSLMSIGVYFLVRSLPGLSDLARCAILLFIQTFPPISTAFAYVSLDALMAASMICGFGVLSIHRFNLSDESVNSMSPGRLGSVIAILSCFYFAIAVRYNGFLAAFPGIGCLVHLLRREVGWRHAMRSGVIALSITGLMVGIANLTPRLLVDVEHFDMLGIIAMHDIAGMVVAKGNLTADESDLLSAAEISERRLTFDDFEAHHSSRSCVPFWTNAGLNKENRTRPEILSLWRKMVLGHPVAYLTHRAKVFHEIVFDPRIDYRLQHTRHVPNEFAADDLPTAERSSFQTHYAAVVEAMRPLVSPTIYLMLGAVSIPLLFRTSKRQNFVVIFLALSGIGYQLGFFFVGSSAMNRFSVWMNISAMSAFVIAVSQLSLLVGNGSDRNRVQSLLPASEQEKP